MDKQPREYVRYEDSRQVNRRKKAFDLVNNPVVKIHLKRKEITQQMLRGLAKM